MCAEPGRGDLRDCVRRAALRRQDHPRPQAPRARLQVRHATPLHTTPSRARPHSTAHATVHSTLVHCSLTHCAHCTVHGVREACAVRSVGRALYALMLMCFSLSSRAQPVHTSTSLASARALGTLEPADSCVSFDVLSSRVLVHDYSRRALAPLTLGISWPSHLSRASRAA